VEQGNSEPLVDWKDREAARRNLVDSLWVEAGAGTGKTTLLVDHYLSVIESGQALVEQVAAITFTEKAAGELKVRLRQAFEDALSQAQGKRRALLIQALGDLEWAPISTIHSFCGSILRERPIEAGLDPHFEPLDEIGLDLLFTETWEQWLKEEIEGKPPALRRALLLGMDLGDLFSLMRLIYDNRDLFPPQPFPKPPVLLDDFVERFHRGLEEAWDLAKAHAREEDRGYQTILSLRGKIAGLRAAPLEQKEVFLFRELQIKPAGNKQKWKPPASCEAQKAILQKLAEEHEELQRSLGASVLSDLLQWARGFLLYMETVKGAQGVLDFQDLLLLTRNLLRDNKEVRRYFQEKYLRLLVDEFQDTDPLQAEIIFFLAEDGTRAGNWEEVELRRGKLFLVGDPKQSIYRFRRADIEIYEKAKEMIGTKGLRLEIQQNFRTVPSILDWVNKLFSELILPVPGEHYQAGYVPLAPHSSRREAHPGQPGVVLLTPSPNFNGPEASVRDTREAEASSIAALIEEMVGDPSGRWGILDKKGAGRRPLGYRDIALLFPTLSGVEAYETALKAKSIPFRLDGGKEFYLRQEVRYLLSALKALDDPADPISLVTVLRSPFFGFSDEEIFLLTLGRNRLNYLLSPSDGGDFNAAFSLLKNLHQTRNSRSIAGTIIDFLSQTKAMEFSLLRPGGEQAVANLKKIVEQARAFDAQKQSTFRRFVNWLETRREESVREGESPWSEEGEENVKLLTIHKAKGLEFPVVILANLSSRRRPRSETFLPKRREGTFEAVMGRFKTLGYDSTLEKEKLKAEAEERRLLYVATTRARDYLVIPLFRSQRNKGYMELLEKTLPPLEKMEPWTSFQGQLIAGAGSLDLHLPERLPLRVNLEERTKGDGPLKLRQNWQESLVGLKEKASQGLPLFTPSSAEEGHGTRLRKPGTGRGAAFGLAFHGVMEKLDLTNAQRLKELCSAKAQEQNIPEMSDEIESLCLRCLHHPFMDRVRNSKRYFREVPFTVSFREKMIEGKIDLLFEEGDGWVILDYKTDQIPREALEERFHFYREQGLWYARAIQQVSRRTVKEVAFYFVRLGELCSLASGGTIPEI